MNICDFNNYQYHAGLTAKYPTDGLNGVLYTALGLASEAGEVAGKIKKVLRDENGEISPEKMHEILAEIGDVLWYCSMLTSELGESLEKVARDNISKLHDRNSRGKIGGSGDNR
jgi:NTP pyrophosphatase (non-canonical NTP hydrolase)